MFFRKAKQCIAVFLILCLCTQLLPVTDVGSTILGAVSKALAEKAFVAKDLDWVLSKQGESRTDGAWSYTLLPEENYAIVTGHSGAAVSALEVPVQLGGADVVGLAEGALADHSALETLHLPGNLRAVGENAIPKGVIIQAYNGTYAQYWASSLRYAFRNLSEFDFATGVVDFADINADAFQRIGQYEMRLRALEADRLSEGTTFFLVDPANPYQISYYRAVSFSAVDETGFVTIDCATPEIGEFLNSFEAKDMPLVLDPSSIEPMEGVDIYTVNNKASNDVNQSNEWAANAIDLNVSVPLDKDGNFTVDFSAQVQVSAKSSGSYSPNGKTSSLSTITIKGTTGVKLEAKAGTDDDDQKAIEELYDQMKTRDEKIKIREKLLERYKDRLPDRYENEVKKEDNRTYFMRLPGMLLMSFAGFFTVNLTCGPYLEFSGSFEGKLTFSKTITIGKTEDGKDVNDCEDPKAKPAFEFNLSGEAKCGFMLAVDINFIDKVNVARTSAFVGISATATLKPIDTATPFDMWDTLEIAVKFVVEFQMSLFNDLGKTGEFTAIKSLFSGTLTVCDLELCTLHFHLFHLFYQGSAYQLKNVFHLAENCPYDKLSAVFRFPALGSNNQLDWVLPEELEPGDSVSEPAEPDLSSYGVAFEGWYLDSAFTKPVTWPYTMGNMDVAFYGKTAAVHKAYYYLSDGTQFTNASVCIEGKEYTLPGAEPSGSAQEYHVVKWRKLYKNDIHSAVIAEYVPGEIQRMQDEDAYYLAVCSNDIIGHFFTGDGREILMNVGLLIDPTLNAPSAGEIGSIPHYTFAGWRDVQGKAVTFPQTVKQGDTRHQYYYALWNYEDNVTASPGASLAISGNGTSYSASSQSGQDYFFFSNFNDTSKTCSVTGYNSQQIEYYYDDEGNRKSRTITVNPGHITIPSSYSKTDSNGNTTWYDVTGVSGLSGWSTLVSVSLPSSIQTISSSCFANSTKLYAISMGSTSITSIPSNFAYNCPNLSSVSVPNSVVSIGGSAFAKCTSITDATIGASIGGSAFAGCTSLSSVSINGGTTSIGEKAFEGCIALTELSLPDSVKSIGNAFLNGCVNLTDLTICRPSTLTSAMMTIGKGSHLTNLTLGDGVVTVGDSAFNNGGNGYTELKNLSISRSVKSIGSNAFKNSGIEVLNLDDSFFVNFGSNAFSGPNLKELTIRRGIVSASAFANCTGLERITLGGGVSIGNYAFSGCTSLTGLNGTIQLDGVVSVGDYAFNGCTALEELEFPDSVTSYGDKLINGCTGLERLVIGGGCRTLPRGTGYSNSSSTFYVGNNSSLNYLEIREGVTTIEKYVFSNSYGWYSSRDGEQYNYYGFPLLSTIILPKSLTSIGERAFYKAGNDTLTIRGNITVWGSEAFAQSGIKHLSVNGTVGTGAFSNCKSLQDAEITAKGIKGNAAIGANAFSGCTALTDVTIGEGVSSVGNNAFDGCASLKALEFPDSVASYGDKLINGCTGLERLVIGGGCRTLHRGSGYPNSSSTFYIGADSSLNHLEIREGVTTIEKYVFSNSYGWYSSRDGEQYNYYGFPLLSTIILPKSLTSIGERAFYKAGNDTLTIRGNITVWGSEAFAQSGIKHLSVNGTVGTGAFSNCKSLQDAEITAKGIKGNAAIGANAFSGCTALTDVTIGEGVSSVGNNAFDGCASLKALEFPDSVASYGDKLINGCIGLERLVIGGGCRMLPKRGQYSDESSTFYVGNNSSLNYLEIREGVTTIEKYVFSNSYGRYSSRDGYVYNYFGFPNLRTIILPQSLISVGDKAFFRAGRTSGIRNLTINGDIITWGVNVFAESSIEEVNVYGNIGRYAFANITTLRSATIGGTATSVAGYAFTGCTSLQSVTLLPGVVNVGEYAFSGCTALKSLEFPDSVIHYGDKLINGCTGLERLIIGGGCRTLLRGTGYPNSSSTFFVGSNSKLNYLEIREGVAVIEKYVFSNSYGWYSSRDGEQYNYFGFPLLSTIILPESLTSIGERAFYKAGNGTLTIRGNITGWGNEAFAQSGIKHLSVNGTVGAGAFSNSKSLQDALIAADGVSEAAVIGNNAFTGCTSLTNVTIGEGVTSVGNNAFNGCTSLKALEFPDSVASYGDKLINGCTGLERLVIGGGCRVLPKRGSSGVSSTFYVGNNPKLKYLEIREGVTTIEGYLFSNSESWYSNRDGWCYNYRGFPSLTTLILPDSLTAIGEKAFFNCGTFSLKIGGNITSWGNQVFGGSKITKLYINGHIGTNAFQNNTNLIEVHITGGGEICSGAFSGCTALRTVTIDEGKTAIGTNAFLNCRSITTLSFPDSVLSYGANMISGCTGIRQLIIGGGCQSLDYAPFYIGAGSSVEEIQIREGVTVLSDYMLANASSASNIKKHGNLTSLILPESLDTIGDNNLNMLPAVRLVSGGSNVRIIGSGTAFGATGSVTICNTVFNEAMNAIAGAYDNVAYSCDGTVPQFTLTVFAVLNGETLENDSSSVTMLQPIVMPDVNIEGWTITGWYEDAAFTRPMTLTLMPGHDLTVYAKLAKAATVTWLADIPEVGSESDSYPGWYVLKTETIAVGESPISPDESIDGRDFVGWYTTPDLTARWVPYSYMLPEDGVTLFGHYAPLYDIEYILVYPDGKTGYYTTDVFGEGKAVSLPPDPDVTGFTLEGWYKEETLNHVFTYGYMVRGGMTLYGKLRRITAGGIYRETEDGLALVSYTPEEDEGTEIYLPAKVNGQTVVSIDAYAFKETEITLINLPAGMMDVDGHAFDGAKMLSALRISNGNEAFMTKDGVLYNKDQTELIRYPQAKPAFNFSIPVGVVSIRAGAFRDAGWLQTVGIPDGILSIPVEAFSDCSGLKSITLPDSVTTLEADAFVGCWAMTEFSANGLTEIGDNAIPHNSGLTVTGPVGEGVLREYCLVKNSDYEYFSIAYNPVTLSLNINGDVFTALTCEKGMPIDTVKIRALVEGFTSLAAISKDTSPILELTNGTIITGWYTDKACTAHWNLAEDVITESRTLYTKSIAKYTYETVDFVTGQTTDAEGNPVEVTTQGTRLTGYFGKGGAVVLPDTLGGKNVMGIAADAFASANGTVASITIGNHVIEIADSAFNDAEGNAFSGAIYTEPGSWAEAWAVEHGYTRSDRQYTLSFVTGGASMAPVQAAYGTVIRVATPVRTGGTFLGWYLNEGLQTPAELENGVLFTMPMADTTLYAAWEMTGAELEYTYYETSSGTMTITGYTGSDKIISVPDQIHGVPVAAIDDRAFEGQKLTRVMLPASVTSVGSYAFADSTISTIDLGGTKVIGEGAFYGCISLKNVSMNAVEEIGAYAFSECVTLPEIQLPDTLVSIGSYAFDQCGGLTSVTIPDGIAELAAYTFNNCSSLQSAHLGRGVTTVSGGVFWHCPALNEITVDEENSFFASSEGILYSKGMTKLVMYPQGKTDNAFALPATVTEIADRAFANAKQLTQITLSDQVCFIGEGAFQDAALTDFTLPANCVVTRIMENTFLGCASLTTVTLNEHVESIAGMAFALCPNLQEIRISENTAEINDLAIGMAQNLTIVGATGSAADIYADKHGYSFSDPSVAEAETLTIEGIAVMQRGETQTLTLTIEPQEAAESTDIAWTSSNPSVLRVTDGYVQALSGGFATVVATARNGITASMEIEIQVAVQSLEMKQTEATAARGEQLLAECAVFPASATNQILAWTSSDESVAAVDETGMITMVNEGEATVTAVSHNGLEASLQLHVYNAIEELIAESNEIVMGAFEASVHTVQVQILPEDSTYRTLLWESSDESVVTVEDGVLTAKTSGSAVIRLTSPDGHAVSAEIAVTVEALDLNEADELSVIGRTVYTGDEQIPEFDLYVNGHLLTKDADYSLTSGKVLNAGQYVLALQGKGLFSGETSVEGFTVDKATPVIGWTGQTVYEPGNTVDTSAFTITPAGCTVTGVLYQIREDGNRQKLSSGLLPAYGRYVLELSVEEADNWYACALETEIFCTGLTLSAPALTLPVGQRVRLGHDGFLVPGTGSEAWESSDESIVRVGENGELITVSSGSAAVTLSGGDYSVTCAVTVTDPVETKLTLPAQMKTISEEAFAGTNAKIAVLPETVISIMAGAFADSPSLLLLYCPAVSAAMADDILRGSPNAVVVCREGTETERTCQAFGIPYVLSTEND